MKSDRVVEERLNPSIRSFVNSDVSISYFDSNNECNCVAVGRDERVGSEQSKCDSGSANIAQDNQDNRGAAGDTASGNGNYGTVLYEP